MNTIQKQIKQTLANGELQPNATPAEFHCEDCGNNFETSMIPRCPYCGSTDANEC